ncbi:MAG: hypothetical protein KC613_22015 [Myxococcales bacterium]|nr:hypothetical protein [Myxococcales bacterium]
MRLSKALILATAMTGLAFAGCNKGGDGEGGAGKPAAQQAQAGAQGAAGSAPTAAASAMLAHIPADSPYVFASGQPMPKEAMDKIFGLFEPLTKKLDEELTKALAEPASDRPEEKVGRALAEELKGNFNRAGLEKLGIDTQPMFALYGVGVLPVMRLTLKDPNAFKAMIGRVETKSGMKAPTAKLGELEYYKISDDGVTAAIAIIGNELVATGGPDGAMAKLLPLAFGQEKPAKTFADAGTLAQINSAYGFQAFGTGVIDLNVIAATVMGDATGTNKAIWDAIGAPTPPLDGVCKGEIKAMVAKAPRMVFGYTEMSASTWAAKYVVELDAGLAKDLAGLTAKLPGAMADKALMQFGLGLDVGKTIEFAKAQVKALQAAPFKCQQFAEFNEGVNQAAAGMNQPLPPVINGLRGLRVVLESGEFTGGQPKNIKGYALLAAEGADQLLAMAKGMVPPLASLNVAADGKAVALPPGMIPPVVEAPHIAMNNAAIAVSVGQGVEAKLSGLLSAAPAEAPVLHFGYDVGEFMKLIQQSAPMGGEEKAILEALGGAMGYTSYGLHFTAKGIEIRQQMKLN